MSELRLVVFDVDGTLVDSQAHILAAMDEAFRYHELPTPPRADILQIVGLSLPVAMARLCPDRPDLNDALVSVYKEAFASLRQSPDGAALSPLFPGAIARLRALAEEPFTLLGVATGKSRRGLRHLFDLHDMAGLFHTVQVADDHPSKPHPSMLLACLAETGVEARRSAIVGDTTYDMEMARAAGICGLGVAWGYHPPGSLSEAGAAEVLHDFDALPAALERRIGPA